MSLAPRAFCASSATCQPVCSTNASASCSATIRSSPVAGFWTATSAIEPPAREKESGQVQGLICANDHKEPMALPRDPETRRGARAHPVGGEVGRRVDGSEAPSERQETDAVDGHMQSEPPI